MAGKVIAWLCVVLLTMACVRTENPPIGQESRQKSSDLPILHLQPAVFQLGDIQEGESASATFLIRNNSDTTMQIVDIQASCGCTVAQPASYTIAPFSFTSLQVSVDTTAKQQHIQKTLVVRNHAGDEAKATLVFNVVENPHGVSKGKIQGIFDGKCATCHFTPALTATTGREVYQAACVMCHGEQGQGAYAPKLRDYSSLSALKEVITVGLGKPQMPAFSQVYGGPLDMQQIEKLSHWLMGLSQE